MYDYMIASANYTEAMMVSLLKRSRLSQFHYLLPVITTLKKILKFDFLKRPRLPAIFTMVEENVKFDFLKRSMLTPFYLPADNHY